MWINTTRPEQYGRNFSDDSFQFILNVSENGGILIEISLKFVPQGSSDNKY